MELPQQNSAPVIYFESFCPGCLEASETGVDIRVISSVIWLAWQFPSVLFHLFPKSCSISRTLSVSWIKDANKHLKDTYISHLALVSLPCAIKNPEDMKGVTAEYKGAVHTFYT